MELFFDSFWLVLAVSYLGLLLLVARCQHRFERNPNRRVPGCYNTAIARTVDVSRCRSIEFLSEGSRAA